MSKPPSRLSESLAPYLADESGGVTKLSISLPTPLLEEVRRTARERGTSVSATIAAALERARDEGPTRGAARTGPAGAGQEPEISGAAVAELARFRGATVGGLIDDALSEWLATRGIRLSPVRDDEWRQRLEAFLERRRAVVEQAGWSEAEIDADVDATVTEVREARAARRH